jgi:hypothetical protein
MAQIAHSLRECRISNRSASLSLDNKRRIWTMHGPVIQRLGKRWT